MRCKSELRMHGASLSWCRDPSADAAAGCGHCGAYSPHAPETIRCIRCRADTLSHGLSSLLSTRLAAATTLRAGGAACACTTQAHHGAVRPLLMLLVAVATVGHTYRMLLRRYGVLAVVVAHGRTV